MAGEKRTQDQEETLLSESVILVDIEGTTTSISFVKDTLFPYVRENLKKYIETKWEDEEFKQDFEKLKEQAKKDEEDKVDGFVSIIGTNEEEERESLVKNVLWQMDGDRKTGALKQLQGHIWREAYNSGTVKAHVYEDVPKALESWTNDSRKVYVYSSGSVEAQKLLFGHSVHGDLLKHFSGYFDTEIGAKQESSSYKNILSKIGAEPSNVIFLTDVVKEAAAAKEAGLSTAIVLREGNAALTDEERVAFTTIKSFLDLSFQCSTKRQKLDATETKETTNKSTPDASEPMDTSEDVEMSDVSEKKVDKLETKEVVKEETKECAKDQLPKETQNKDGKMEDSMVTDAKDTSNAEKVMEKTSEKLEVQPSEVSTKQDTSENVQSSVAGNAESTVTRSKKDTNKPVVAEKVEKPMDTTEKTLEPKAESAVTTNDPLAISTSEPISKPDEASTTESKTEESTKTIKETKSEDTKVSDAKPIEDTSQEKDKSNSIDDKSAECTNKSEKDTKESTEQVIIKSSTMEIKKSETEESSAKKESPVQELTKAVEKPAENGDIAVTDAEKITAPTITEPEATSSKVDANADAKSATEAGAETKPETESESTNVKSPKAKETDEGVTATNDTAKTVNAEASKQELTEKSTKEETVADEVKEKNTVDTEKKKLNGTTQNGETDAPVKDDKLQRNGLNDEGSSKENAKSPTSESTSAQNGEPESSSEASAESIKVKKVVDSTVADGAGEPDVVPPVVVAATS